MGETRGGGGLRMGETRGGEGGGGKVEREGKRRTCSDILRVEEV